MPLPRSGARATTSVARVLLVAVLALAGVTCTDSSPTGPVAPNEASLTGSDVVITPATDTVLVGGSATLSAKLANGSALSKTAVWTSSDTSVAVVTSTGVSTARVTGRKPGRATITATSGTKSGTSTTVVLPVPVRSVTVTPDSASIERGDSVQFTAVPRDSAGNPLTGRTVTWSVADYNVAGVSATGRASGLARGATVVTATSEGVSGSAPITVRVAQLVVPSISAQDTLNAGDTIRVVYAVQNLGDRFDADSVIVRVGFRNGDGYLVAVRRALPRIAAGATITDTARFLVPAGTAGLRQVAAYADCRDLTGATDATRLTSCESDPANAGAIGEGSESDNERTRNVVVRGAELGATLAGPDTVRTRTTASLTVTITNSGSATGSGFDVVAGIYDITTGTVIAATAATTPALGSRETRAIPLDVAVPATATTSHRYELRAWADCPVSGTSATQALQLCIANSSGGAIIESAEADNLAAAPTAVVSNVARVVVLPDTIRLTAIGDTASLAAAAYDAAGAPVQGVAFTWSALGSAATVTNGLVRAVVTGSARVVATGEGRADTATVIVAQAVARVVAAPDTARLAAIGDTTRFSAAAFDANGNAVPGATYIWTSLDPAIASVSAAGSARAVANGTARLVASSGSMADTVAVIVAQEVATVAVTPDQASLSAFGDTVALAATARDRSGATMASATITWSSLDPTIASVSAVGVATAHGDGQARIVASSGSASDTAVVTVQQAVARVVATPDTARLAAIGDSTRFTATAFDANGNAMPAATLAWNTLDPTVATVSPSGSATAVANGTARIVASSNGSGDTVLVVVSQQVATVAASPDSAMLTAIGATATFDVTARDRMGTVVAGAAVAWSSLDPGVASVSAAGVATALANGRARLVASSGAAADTTIVFVAQAVARVTATPDSVRLTALGDTARFGATALDANGSTVSTTISWTSLDPAVATVGADGLAAAVSGGAARLVASSAGAADTVQVTVAQEVSSLYAPDSMMLSSLGDSGRLYASASDRGGAPVAGAEVVWSALDPGIATVSAEGDVRAVANGRARAVATSGVAADTTIVIVRQLVVALAAAPDSVVLLSLGDTARFVAGAADRRGNPVADAVVVWTSLDPAVATVVAPGAARSVATGRARIVAASGDAADTVVIVSQQAVASVEITADTTLTHDDENVVLTAVLRDAAGNVMPGAPDMWWSMDPAVSVDSTGRVTPMSLGDAHVIARYGTHTDTAVVLVNPAGYGFRWLGAQYGGWSNPGNWYPHQVPQRDTDDVYVPARTVNRPTLSGYALVGAVRVDELAMIDLAGFNMLANGDVDARGSIDGGIVEMRGAGTVSGNLYQLEVKAPVTLAGRTVARYAIVRDGGTLTLAGHTLASSNVGTDGSGTLVEDNAADSIVTGMANFGGQGATRLTAGVLKVSGSFYQYGPAGSFTVGGTHRTVFDGPYAHTASFSDTTVAGFQDVEVVDAHGLAFQSGGNVRGLLRLAPGAGVSAQGNLRFLTRLPDVSQGSYDVQSTVVAGDVVADRNFTTAGSLFAMDNARLTLNGHRIEARWMATQNAVLVMNQPADTLLLHDGASLYGTEQLSAGTTIVRGGSLFVNAPYGGGNGFDASGTHTLVFDGGPSQTINFDQPDRHRIANLRVTNGATLAFQTDAHVAGRLTVDANSAVTQGNGGKIYYHGPLPDVAAGRYDVWSSVVASDLALDRDVTLPASGSLMIDDAAVLSLNGHRLEVGTLYSQMNGRLVMPGVSPAETLVVRGDANLYGATELRGGVLDLHGSLWMRGVPVPTTAPIGTRTIFSGAVQHTFDTNDWQTDSLVIGDVEVRDGGTLSFSRALVLNGLLTLGQGSTLSGGNSEVRLNRALPDIERGTVQIGGLVVRGDVTMDADRHYDGSWFMLRVAPGGWLRMNGHTLSVGSFADEAGSAPSGLVMDDARDSLVISTTAYMFGTPHLTAGTMVIKGDFQHDGNWGVQTFAPTGTHTTVFAGSAAQHIRLDGTDGSHFNNLSIDNAAGVDLESSLTLTGQLRGAGNGVLRSTNGYAVHASGLDVAGLVLDGVAVESNGGTLARFDNVTFQNLSPYQPGQLTIRHPGLATAFTLHNIAFLTETADGYGSWLVAEDTDAATAPLALDVVSPQAATGPSHTQTLGGATVSWRSEVAATP